MRISRRSVLKSALIAPAGIISQSGANVSVGSSSFDPWVEVHTQHFRLNAGEISKRVAGRPILAVIKNNGYGAGVERAAKSLEGLDSIAGFAVIKLSEALKLREAGIKKRILLLGPTSEEELRVAVTRQIMPMVYTKIGSSLDRAVRGSVPIHVCVDTGLGRVGVPHQQAAALIRDLATYRSIRIEGIMMTFAEDAAFDGEQLIRFNTLCDSLSREGIRIGQRHAASSYALFQHPDSFLDMVRPGMALYGCYPEAQFRTSAVLNLRPTLALRCRVAYVKKLVRGESAGYNRAYVAKGDVWIATLPVGHADGIPRQAARGGHVRIRGVLYPIIASVSASHSIVELGGQTQIAIGDVATIFDWEEGSRPEDFAVSFGGSVYDLLMHLNPLLPRRVLAV